MFFSQRSLTCNAVNDDEENYTLKKIIRKHAYVDEENIKKHALLILMVPEVNAF